MKFSRATVPTLKEKPADADIASHELLLRAGMMRSFAAGIYTMLPLGLRALDRVEDVVREEMNAAGALEVMLPTIQPGEAWKESGRWFSYGPEMMRLKDRQGREFCLAPTAEELITMTVGRQAPSYRDLPLNLYQIQTKFRDEMRPRFGLLRAREFRMKDAYSFHADAASLDETYAKMHAAYIEVAQRCSLDVRVVEATSGLIGGDESAEFMVISDIGEDVLVFCDTCTYGANAELEVHAPGGRFGSDSCKMEDVATPGTTSIYEVARLLDTTPDMVLKCVLYTVKDKPLAVFVPGYRDVSEAKLAKVLETDDFHQMREDEREQYPGLCAGFIGPVGLDVPALYDREIAGATGFVCGANREGFHAKGVEEGRDFKAEPHADVAMAVEGDTCARCGGKLDVARGIEIGHIFKLGTKYSATLGADFTDVDGGLRPMIMGTYGIGTSRMLATIVEQHNDSSGIRWPKAVAPLPVEIIMLSPERDDQAGAAASLEEALAKEGHEVLVDDRDASPGVKFNDADLVGLPVQVVLGKKVAQGSADVKVRYSQERREVSLDALAQEVVRALADAP